MERYLGGWSRRKGRNKGVDNRQPGVTLGDGTERKLSDYDSKKGVPLLLLSVKSWIENAPVRRATIAQAVAEISFSHDRIISPYSSRFLIVFFFFFFWKKKLKFLPRCLRKYQFFTGKIFSSIPRARKEKNQKEIEFHRNSDRRRFFLNF